MRLLDLGIPFSSLYRKPQCFCVFYSYRQSHQLNGLIGSLSISRQDSKKKNLKFELESDSILLSYIFSNVSNTSVKYVGNSVENSTNSLLRG